MAASPDNIAHAFRFMSLDGFINDRDGGVSRLYPDFEGMQQSALERTRTFESVGVTMLRYRVIK